MKKISKFLSVMLCLTLLLSVAVIPSVSADAQAVLTDLTFDGYTVPNFDPARTEYTVTLPYRHGAADNYTPVVTAAAEAGGSYEVSIVKTKDGAQVHDKAGTVTVTATKAGAANGVYTINYKVVGDNLLWNGGFEAWGTAPNNGSLDSWQGRGDHSVKVNDVKIEGNAAVRISGSSKYIHQPINFTAPDPNKDTSDPDTLNIGWTYLYSGQFMVPEGDGFFTAQDEGPKVFNLYDGKDNIATLQCSTEWQRLTAVAACHSNSYVSITPWWGAGSYYYVDDFYAGELVIADIQITGAPEEAITAAGVYDLNATAVNQLGTTHGMNHDPFAWRLVNAPAGVTIDSASGEVTVAEGTDFTGNVIAEVTTVPKLGPEAQWAVQTYIGKRVSIPVNMVDNTKARLSDLVFDGFTVPGFDPKVTEYNVALPYRHDAEDKYTPVVEAVAEAGGSYVVDIQKTNDGKQVHDKAGVVTVTSKKSGLNDVVYTINYKVVGDNLLWNGGFEEWGNALSGYGSLDSWQNRNNYASKVNDVKVEGNAAAKLTHTSGNSIYQSIDFTAPDPDKDTSDPDTINVGWTYLFSGQFKVEEGAASLNNSALYHLYDGANNLTNLPASTEWQRLTTTVAGRNGFYIMITPWSAAGTYYVDDFFAGELVAGDIKVTGADSVVTEAGVYDLNGTIVNQIGTTDGMTQTAITWRLVDAPAGVTINAATGEVTVPDNCTGKIVVEATAPVAIGPAAQQARQSVIGKRVALLAAVNAPATVTYGTDGDTVTPTINWFNATGESKTVRAYTALYSLVGTQKVLEDVVVNNAVTVANGELYNTALAPITKQAGCTIETFVWTTDYRPLIGPFAY